MTTGEQPLDQLTHETQVAPEICEVSLEAARQVLDPILASLKDADGVLYKVANARAAQMPAESRLGIAPSLLADPRRTGIVVPRYQTQEGSLPTDASAEATADQAVVLWAAEAEGIPKLRVPEGCGDAVMALADKMQLRGGGPTIFAREEVSRMQLGPRALVRIDGGANKANLERVQTALDLAEAAGYARPILATVDPMRQLKEAERQTVAGFAPEARNEYELFIASAQDKGFVLDQEAHAFGIRYLPDGSSYVAMKHAEKGIPLIVLAPAKIPDATGKHRSGVFNSYHTLVKHGADILGEGFDLNGIDMVAVTSTHYGAMSALNNLRVGHELRLKLGSYRVVGDNQPTRTAQAHLIEIGLTLDAATRAGENAALKAALLQEADNS